MFLKFQVLSIHWLIIMNDVDIKSDKMNWIELSKVNWIIENQKSRIKMKICVYVFIRIQFNFKYIVNAWLKFGIEEKMAKYKVKWRRWA